MPGPGVYVQEGDGLGVAGEWVVVEDSGSVGWFAWRDCAAVEAARLSAGERGIAMRRLRRFSVAAALAHGFLRRSDTSLPRETVG